MIHEETRSFETSEETYPTDVASYPRIGFFNRWCLCHFTTGGSGWFFSATPS
jgi:hypothetical protein